MSRYYYHISRQENIHGILTEGLIPGKGKPLLGEVEFPDTLWLDSSQRNLTNWMSTGKFTNCVLLRIDSHCLERARLSRSGFEILGKKTWWKYKGVIPSVTLLEEVK